MSEQILLLCSDPNLGRVDYNSLSDQTLMEMLIDGLDEETKEKFQDTDKMYLDVCEWDFVKCDADNRVVEICARSKLSGSIQLQYTPPKVTHFRLVWSQSNVHGTIDLTHLPEAIQKISITGTQLSGSIDLEQLPHGMLVLSLISNCFTREINLSSLPGRMKKLTLSDNKLTGSINLTQLPQDLENLYLHSNQFQGSINLTQLPGSLQDLFLNNNQLSGSLYLGALPQAMVRIKLQNNSFSGSFIAMNLPLEINLIIASKNSFQPIAVVQSDAYADIDLRESGVTSVVDESGDTAAEGVWL